jgi:hypothetical protein
MKKKERAKNKQIYIDCTEKVHNVNKSNSFSEIYFLVRKKK